MASSKSGLPAKKASLMRPPTMRPSRAQSVTPSLNGRASPAESIASTATGAGRSRSPTSQAGTKRKERDYEFDAGQETNINVVVRCRGRSDREVRENSGVVVSTDGVKGRNVELSMGPSALSNKTYHFDKAFSPAADQTMIFDEVVNPILTEVLSGFNCTIFAYGQTGTGKTYTMSGDISDVLPLPDGAGIIPRVLYELFKKLDGEESENSVKVSFIELYNEELRDLLAADDGTKLKIYENNTQKGHTATMVQGMEETHIKTARKGIQLLREGSHKRQVAATKCNDLSSRSHTIFTVTVYMKRTSDTGEDYVSAGKLNLVDLAGSENIQRSGAENKRAAEAGLINKSLLTLGRVINALVDKSSHIPYRESKLTRLLQDSLGGRTKTCIIATLSPAKSNLEETISTLDYAFRAKNIRNKPQINAMVSKKTLLKEFTAEIEKLKSELIATRQRNGVYLTQETYEEMTTESESRRILSEEQRDKIETLENNLRNKVQELFSLTSNFNSVKKDNEATKLVLEGTKSILEKTEVVLAHTRQNLAEETVLRRAHQKTEANLTTIGHNLISTLGQTTSDIGGLHSKLRRRSDLQSMNRQHWSESQEQVSNATFQVEKRMDTFRDEQEALMMNLSSRMQEFVQQELGKLEASQAFLAEKMVVYQTSEKEVNEQTAKARDDMDEVLEEIKTLREDVKQKVGAGLNDLSAAAQRISAGIATELEAFQTQLHSSYASLGKEFKSSFDDLLKSLGEHHAEANDLRQRIVQADQALVKANKSAQSQLSAVVEEEKLKAAEERQELLTQIASMINQSAEAQQTRMQNRLDGISANIETANNSYNVEHEAYNHGVDALSAKSTELIANVTKSRDNMKAKVRADYATANDYTASLQSTTTSVHDSTVKIVEAQMAQMDTQLHSLDEIITRVRTQNSEHHATHTSSLATLASTVQESYSSIGDHFKHSFSRIQDLNTTMSSQTDLLLNTLPALTSSGDIRTSLRSLREDIQTQTLIEYAPTGQTPQKTAYAFPSTLPRTDSHDALLTRLRSGAPIEEEDEPAPAPARSRSPSKGMVFADADIMVHHAATADAPTSPSSRPPLGASLRERDVNAHAASDMLPPPLKRQNTSGLDRSNTTTSSNTVVTATGFLAAATAAAAAAGEAAIGSKLPMKKARATVVGGAPLAPQVASLDRENLVADFSKSVGHGASVPGLGRRLRSRGG